MNSKMLNGLRAAMLAPLTVLSLAAGAQAQTAMPMASSASMPMAGMPSGASGSADMKQSMMAAWTACRR